MENLYLDFNLNKERLKSALKRIKRNNKEFFQDQIEGEDDLSYFINAIYEDNKISSYYVSNTSIYKGKIDYTIRPKLTRELRSKLCKGKTILIRTHPSKDNDYLIVDRIVDIYNTSKRDFEKEIKVNIKVIKERSKTNIEDNVLDEEILKDLEPISKITGEKIKLWESYLNWKLKIIKNKLSAVKYIKKYIDNEYITFELLCEKEDIKNIKKLIKSKDIKAFQNKYSSDRWKFKYNDDPKNYNRPQNLGGLYNLEEPISVEKLISDSFYKEIYNECEYYDPYIIKVQFEFSEEDMEDIDECPQIQIEDLMNRIINRYDDEGYLSESAIGEFILINRQKKILNSIKLGESYSPYLASWLFDIKEANHNLQNIEIDNLLNESLNEDQKKAVERIIKSPEVCLVQGPPGTGKTTVIAEAIYQFAKQGKKVILSSQANLAVDNVLDRLIMTPQVRAIRLGKSTKISEEGKKFSEEMAIESFYKSIADTVKKEYLDKYDNKLEKLVALEDWINENKHLVINLEKEKSKMFQIELDIENVDDKINREKKQAILKGQLDRSKMNQYYNSRSILETESEELEQQIENYNKEILKNLKSLSGYISLTGNMHSDINTIKKEINKLRIAEKDKEKRKKINEFIKEWHDKLIDKETIENDNKYFMEKYIDACNVVGVTCTENEKTLEKYNQVSFDVAIIDEVSKATPPELLIPMSKAKQCILVGDHRQLPPIFKDKIDETKEKKENTELEKDEEAILSKDNFEKYENMVTASLFKEYFEVASEEIKTALFTQYRMHPEIMDLINYFYEGKLKCGLSQIDIEKNRSHGLTLSGNYGLKYITPDRHAVWVDSSRLGDGNPYYEKQEGTSKVNLLEVKCIIKTLKLMEEECKLKGFSKNNKKDIGVISFYGKQIQVLRKEIKKLKLEALNVDINTVDKFQGKEKSIILVSLVRNLKTSKKEGGFVGSFERINVAFSRAKELLVIFGAKEMFEDYLVTLPNMESKGSKTINVYNNIINKIKLNGCFVDNSKILTDEDYKDIVEG